MPGRDRAEHSLAEVHPGMHGSTGIPAGRSNVPTLRKLLDPIKARWDLVRSRASSLPPPLIMWVGVGLSGKNTGRIVCL